MHEKCPNCDSTNLGDRWASGRMLQQHCYDCEWNAVPRIPTPKPIESVKKVSANQFSGWEYHVFDKYGHAMTFSRAYSNREEALESMRRELAYGKTDSTAGPYTGVLWPPTVEVTGEVFT